MADKSSFYRERAKALEKRLEHEQKRFCQGENMYF